MIINCISCKQKLKVGSEQQGKVVKCPNCQSQMKVPQANPQAPPPPSEPAKPTPISADQSGNPKEKELGGYELLGKLGEGGMARVFRARRKSDGKLVALKVLRGSLASQPDAVRDFIVEAKAAAALKHPYLPEVYDAGEADGHYFFAMEIISGATLQKVIEKQGAIPENGALTIAKYVTEILCFAWERKVIHRDIKPENLMVQPDLSLKLMDMGLAKAAGDGKATSGEGGGIIGTPMYASPEQIRGQKDLDCRSDIYSLGLTIYHAVTGELPYNATTSAMVMAKQLNEELPDPRLKNPDLSLNLTMMIKKMTEKDRDRRYQAPEDLLGAIENCRQRLIDRQAQQAPVEKPKKRGFFKR